MCTLLHHPFCSVLFYSILFFAVKEGRNRGKLYDLQKSKDEIQVKVDKLYAEYEGLLELIE
jgi:hypothetical protein